MLRFQHQHQHKNAFDEKVVAEFLEGRGLTLASLMGIQYVIKGGLLELEGKQELANLLQREGWRLEWLDVHTFVISQ